MADVTRGAIDLVASRGWAIIDTEFALNLDELNRRCTTLFRDANLIEFSRKQLPEVDSNLWAVVNQIESQALNTAYQPLTLSKVWFQRSTKEGTESAMGSVPFVPHIDGSRYFKAMLYVRDVKKNDGPMKIMSKKSE